VLIEGQTALFRIGMALIYSNEEEILKCNSAATLYNYLMEIPSRARRSDRLIQLAFDRFKNISESDILARREQHIQALKEEMGMIAKPASPSKQTTTGSKPSKLASLLSSPKLAPASVASSTVNEAAVSST
jgi:hypothetical protein